MDWDHKLVLEKRKVTSIQNRVMQQVKMIKTIKKHMYVSHAFKVAKYLH